MKKVLNRKLIFILLALLGLASCNNQKPEIIPLNFEKDLVPEGFAIDANGKRIYLNSLKYNKIVSSFLDGSNPQTFLKTNDHNYLPGFGMTIKGDTLYALGNSLTKGENKSILLLLQLPSGNLIDSYTLNDSNFHYWNDLAISSTNEIFITDSESNKIYRIRRPEKAIETYLNSPNISNSNGITISNTDDYLYLASTKGICIVETSSRKLTNTPRKEHAGVDGLKFHENKLYAIVNARREQSQNGLFKFELNESGTEITASKKMVDFTEDFKIPTTFDMYDGNIYFVTNTQLDNFDENTKKILDLKKLESYKMMKIQVE